MRHMELLSADYEALYVKMLTDVATAHPRRRESYDAFWPMRGRDYDNGKGMFLIGRATNGWMEEKDGGSFIIPDGGGDAKQPRIDRLFATAASSGESAVPRKKIFTSRGLSVVTEI